MGLFKTYKTDTSLEKKGIVYTPDAGTAITLARAGGSNTKFSKALAAKTKPYRRQIEAGTFDSDLDRKIMAEVFASTIILSWETLVHKDGSDVLISGIEADPENLSVYDSAPEEFYSADGTAILVVPFTQHNVTATLFALPDMMLDLTMQAQNASNYLAQEREDAVKN